MINPSPSDLISRIHLASSMGIKLSQLKPNENAIKKLAGCISWITKEKISVIELSETLKEAEFEWIDKDFREIQTKL
ncbi:MAG: hypothetical protein NDF54_04940 [archaeon GB-1867-035]|nr:hypothetical protein [Candidatus Culexmicrobium profundum]